MRSKRFFLENLQKYRFIGQFIRTVVFKIGSDDLEENLEQVVCVRMNPCRCIVGFKKFPDKTDHAGFSGEFFDQKKACIGRKITAVKIYFHMLIAIKRKGGYDGRSEEHTSELQSRQYLVCRLLLEKKKNTT